MRRSRSKAAAKTDRRARANPAVAARIPRWTIAGAAILAASRLFPIPPLRDGVTGEPLLDWTIEPSLAHLATTPLSLTADWLTCLSARQLAAFGVWFLAAYPLARALRGRWHGARGEALRFAAHLGAFVALATWTVLLPRPAARLSAPPQTREDVAAVDFHSHTSRSWDGRKAFSAAANLRWHAAMGFDAAFITDHNRQDGSEEAFRLAEASVAPAGARPLRGVELSLHDAHVVALGARAPIDPGAYPGREGLLRFLEQSRRRHRALALMSLPEYWRHHRDRLEELAAAGAAGFELVNAAPKALDVPAAGKDYVVGLCRRRGRFLAAVSDNHGWARSACAWSLARLPGHRRMPLERFERELLKRLEKNAFDAVRIVERPLPRPDSALALAFDPPRWAWRMLRSMSRAQAAVCLAWLLLAAAAGLLRNPKP